MLDFGCRTEARKVYGDIHGTTVADPRFRFDGARMQRAHSTGPCAAETAVRLVSRGVAQYNCRREFCAARCEARLERLGNLNAPLLHNVQHRLSRHGISSLSVKVAIRTDASFIIGRSFGLRSQLFYHPQSACGPTAPQR